LIIVGIFSGSKSKVVIPAEAIKAMQAILQIGRTPLNIPGLNVPGMTGLMQYAQQLARQYLEGPASPSYMQGRDILRDVAGGKYADPSRIPGYSAALDRFRKLGSGIAQRTARGIQRRGMGRSTPFGRAITNVGAETTSAATAAMLPLHKALYDSMVNAARDLTTLGRYETEQPRRGAEFATTIGAIPRAVELEQAQAIYNQLIQQVVAPFTYQVPALEAVGRSPAAQPVVKQGSPSILSQVTPLISALGPDVMSSFGGSLFGGLDSLLGGAGRLLFGGGPTTMGPPTAGILSDKRYKVDIASIEDALEKLDKIDGKTFRYKGDNGSNAGVLAQDIEKVLPEAVFERDGVKYVKYEALIALLLNAVKELQGEVDRKVA
jgi:hypothetical protein